jgi:hypothetical protein
MARKKWADLSSGQRKAVMALGAVEVALATAAYIDLIRRPAEQVNGSKGKWAAIILVNIVGPLSYFARGRRTEVPPLVQLPD